MRGLHLMQVMSRTGCTAMRARQVTVPDLSSRRKAMSTSVTFQRRPVVLIDVMDTICCDPFFREMPKFFDMSFEELLKTKHPTAWIEFECGLISEDELFSKFFVDGRLFDGHALVQHMIESYDFVEGMENLLERLHAANIELHAMSNYPMW